MPTTHRIFSDRIMSSTAAAGKTEWYCLAREDLLGPYSSETTARIALSEFILWCQRMGATGGREAPPPPARLRIQPRHLY